MVEFNDITIHADAEEMIELDTLQQDVASLQEDKETLQHRVDEYHGQ